MSSRQPCLGRRRVYNEKLAAHAEPFVLRRTGGRYSQRAQKSFHLRCAQGRNEECFCANVPLCTSECPTSSPIPIRTGGLYAQHVLKCFDAAQNVANLKKSNTVTYRSISFYRVFLCAFDTRMHLLGVPCISKPPRPHDYRRLTLC